MTLFDAIKSDELLSNFDDNKILLAFELRDVNHRMVASTSSLQSLELVTADLYQHLLLSPKFSEGDLSIEYDKQALSDYIKKIANKYDDEKLKEDSGTVGGEIVDITEEW